MMNFIFMGNTGLSFNMTKLKFLEANESAITLKSIYIFNINISEVFCNNFKIKDIIIAFNKRFSASKEKM